MGRRKNKKIQAQGFTLIELLLVITIIAVMTAFAILTYRTETENNRVAKAALEMQHVLEASMAFRVDSGNWPKENSDYPSCVASDTNFINYLPNHNYVSNFGNNFCWASEGQNAQLFWVALKAPGQGQLAEQIAQRIAARLPNAIITSDPKLDQSGCNGDDCYVRAEVTRPGIVSDQNVFQVIAGGNCVSTGNTNNGNSECDLNGISNNIAEGQRFRITTTETCPSSSQEKLYVSPNWIISPWKPGSYGLLGTTVRIESYPYVSTNCSSSNTGCCDLPNGNGTQCYAQVNIDFCTREDKSTNNKLIIQSANQANMCSMMDYMHVHIAHPHYSAGQEGVSYIIACVPAVPTANKFQKANFY